MSDIPMSDIPMSDIPMSDIPMSDIPTSDIHTAGPWQSNKIDVGESTWITAGEAGALNLALVWGKDAQTRNPLPAAANARMMAAAPALLDACRALVSACNRRDMRHGQMGVNEYREALAQANDAIARAILLDADDVPTAEGLRSG